MKTALRLDDITPDMDFDKFNRLKKILDTYQIKPLIGVVPFNEDTNLKRDEIHTDFTEFLTNLKKEGYQIALHGYHHIYTTKKGGLFPLNDFSEYAGVPYGKQLTMIKEGKAALEKMGIETDIFMAPAHSYDKNTLKALKDCGFCKVTDGFGKYPYKRCGLTFYPIAFSRLECFKEKKGYTTLVIHANSIEDNEFVKYEEMFAKNKESFIPYEDYLKIPAKSRSMLINGLEYMMAKTKHVLVKMRTR